MNGERVPTDEELWPPGYFEDQEPHEIDESWQGTYLDEEEVRLAADLAGVSVGVRPDMGTIQGMPFLYLGAGTGRFEDEFLNGLTIESARALVKLLGHAYAQTCVKLLQFRGYVPKEIIGRDPGVVIGIVMGVERGQSDSEIAAELGETEKFVQRVRLEVGRKQVDGPFKRTRGRPRKDSAA